MWGSMRFRFSKTVLACAVAAFAVATPAAAQGSYSPYNETATAALARYVRELAQSPGDFNTLIRAGRASLEVGDTAAAAGFFARADEINPRSPLPHAGMGAVNCAQGEPYAALPYFNRAQQLGASVASFGADRGLAYDLLGRQAEAQADYRAALNGPDRDTALARLALSLAISGNRAEALSTLAPLMAKGDPAGARARAFVLALTGDPNAARIAIDAATPGSASQVAPFLARLTSLNSGQKAAAVNLGLFPDANAGTAYAYSAPVIQQSSTGVVGIGATSGSVVTNRLAGVDDLLRTSPLPTVRSPAAPLVQAPQARVQLASVQQPRAAAPQASRARGSKIWLQLASGSDAESLPGQFDRIKRRNETLFDGISGYVARTPDRARLLIGPFHSASDADTFAADLESVHVNAFKWKNSDSDMIVPLGRD